MKESLLSILLYINSSIYAYIQRCYMYIYKNMHKFDNKCMGNVNTFEKKITINSKIQCILKLSIIAIGY